MATSLDELGNWRDLGTLSPDGNWQSFPVVATAGLSIFRVSWGGDLSKILSRVYLRSVYLRGGIPEPAGRWARIYPKAGAEIILLPLAQELGGTGIDRTIQATKWYRYLRNGINIDSPYSLNLQEFQPLPQFAARMGPLTPLMVEEIINRVLSSQQNTNP